MKYPATESESFAAGLLCLFGFLLHMLLSGPVLDALGVRYSGEEGHFYEKIHPGTVFIFLSLPVLLTSSSNPIAKAFALYRRHTAFSVLLLLDILLFFYMAARSGTAGLAFFLETHVNAVICAIVFSYAPRILCQIAVRCFIVAVLVNALAGIAEAAGKFRLFAFDPEWSVLHEEYFRASAFMGHPLDNAVFTSVALFVLLALDLPAIARAFFALLLMVGLIAFGGRIAMAVALTLFIFLQLVNTYNVFASGHVTLLRAFAAILAFIVVPLCIAMAFYLAIYGGAGERIAASVRWDSSADSRLLVFKALSYLKDEELWFGVSGDRILNILDRMQSALPVTDIENPWILMCMYLGLITFPFWLMATFAFIVRLMKNQPLALQLAVLDYFLVASTANSFGRKEANYAIMVSAVICAGRTLRKLS